MGDVLAGQQKEWGPFCPDDVWDRLTGHFFLPPKATICSLFEVGDGFFRVTDLLVPT